MVTKGGQVLADLAGGLADVEAEQGRLRPTS